MLVTKSSNVKIQMPNDVRYKKNTLDVPTQSVGTRGGLMVECIDWFSCSAWEPDEPKVQRSNVKAQSSNEF